MVWPKMPESDFVHINARDAPDECGPRVLLEEIYDFTVKEEINYTIALRMTFLEISSFSAITLFIASISFLNFLKKKNVGVLK